jgi:proline iminopeptidase
MQGPSEFTMSGVLENWDVSDKLKGVNIPTLILRGKYDTMSMRCSQKIKDSMPKGTAKIIEIPRAAHCKLIDEPELCVEETYKFLKSQDFESVD